VIKARLAGEKRGTGGKVDILMLREMEPGAWEALVSPSRRIHPAPRSSSPEAAPAGSRSGSRTASASWL